MSPHLCLDCRNKLDSVPDEVLIETTTLKLKSEIETEVTYTKVKETVNISDDLKKAMEEMKGVYKYVFYCTKLQTITVGSDSPAQQRKECEFFAE